MKARRISRFTAAGMVLCCLALSCGAATGKVRAYRGQLTLPTYPWAAVKHPYFRGTDSVNIYPYPMLDFLSREKTNLTYQTVVLENEHLKITFLPELGGKIHEVTVKETGQPMFYVNDVIKPGLIGQCGAWTSGGVEWNTGPQGHTVSAMQPVSVEILPAAADGSRSVVIGECERIFGTRWTVVVTLRPGRSFIEERIRIYNPTETIRPYYFWNCTAMPNTSGFRFIYPMTLGCDHGAEKFFEWPIDDGKDLTRGTNYQDASSIFAWHCDQDFFGSYDDQANRGVVSYANHHQLPGKKAWTWGQGGFGKMHQMDLTDSSGPYNEVQTGPLLTQGEVGRLDPCEAVSWEEWWYPVRGIGGFTFANRDVAVNAVRKAGAIELRIASTGTWKNVEPVLRVGRSETTSPAPKLHLSPSKPVETTLPLPETLSEQIRVQVTLRHQGGTLAAFEVPLNLPERKPPGKKPNPETATQLAERGWEHFLFAKFTEAESQFRKALEKDARFVGALTGLAFLRLDSDPGTAAGFATQALEVEPGCGLASYALAVAQSRTDAPVQALDNAWKASLSPASAVAGRALVAKLLLRERRFKEAVQALADAGPWANDPLCRDLHALALFELNRRQEAATVARQSLEQEPLDAFARCVLWLARAEPRGMTLSGLIARNRQVLPDLLADFSEAGLRQPQVSLQLAREFPRVSSLGAFSWRDAAEFPHRLELIPELHRVLGQEPGNGTAALALGHLLFHSGRFADGRALWRKAAELGAEPVIAYRALGMASLTLDNDAAQAASLLSQAHQLDKSDAIVARDLARVLFKQADASDSKEQKTLLLTQVRDTLNSAFDSGKQRSDFVALLARAQNRLGEFAQTARMLDTVRVTVWEGSREVHDLFEDAHLELGKNYLASNQPADALREFNRALEYPDNLATGKLENTREAHLHYLRGNALAKLGRIDEAKAAWKLAADEPKSSDSRKEEARQKAREALGLN